MVVGDGFVDEVGELGGGDRLPGENGGAGEFQRAGGGERGDGDAREGIAVGIGEGAGERRGGEGDGRIFRAGDGDGAERARWKYCAESALLTVTVRVRAAVLWSAPW